MVVIMWSKLTCAVITLIPFAMLIQVSKEQPTCSKPEPVIRRITDKDGAGTNIFISPKTKDATYIFAFDAIEDKGTHYFKSFFHYILKEDRWVMQLTKPMEQSLLSNWSSQGLFLSVLIQCSGDAKNKNSWVRFPRLVHLRHADECDLLFTTEKAFTVHEDTPVGSVVARMDRLFTDKDFKGKPSIVNYFVPIKYEPKLNDGSNIFQIKKNGEMVLKRPLDYEMGDRTYGLGIEAHDFSNQTAKSFVEARVININDKPPMFANKGCHTQCNASYYAAVVPSSFVGPLNNYIYGPIHAVDADGDAVEYSFVRGSPEAYQSYVAIDKDSGSLSILKPLAQLSPSITQLNIIIQAKSISTLPKSRVSNVTDFAEALLQIELSNANIQFMKSGGFDREPANVFLFLLGKFVILDLTLSL